MTNEVVYKPKLHKELTHHGPLKNCEVEVESFDQASKKTCPYGFKESVCAVNQVHLFCYLEHVLLVCYKLEDVFQIFKQEKVLQDENEHGNVNQELEVSSDKGYITLAYLVTQECADSRVDTLAHRVRDLYHHGHHNLSSLLSDTNESTRECERLVVKLVTKLLNYVGPSNVEVAIEVIVTRSIRPKHGLPGFFVPPGQKQHD